MEFHSAVKHNTLLIHIKPLINLKIIMLNDRQKEYMHAVHLCPILENAVNVE